MQNVMVYFLQNPKNNNNYYQIITNIIKNNNHIIITFCVKTTFGFAPRLNNAFNIAVDGCCIE